MGFHTSDQHKEVSHARKERDKKDITSILSFLTDRNPFLDDSSLRNIDTGTTADSRVNADRTKEIGTNIIQSMSGQNIVNFTFKISQQVITLSTKNQYQTRWRTNSFFFNASQQLQIHFLKIHQTSLNMNSVVFHLLFLIHAVFLWKHTSLLWQMQSGALGTVVLRKRMTNVHYVLDGGSLLQRIPWTKGDLFSTTCMTYVNYVTQKVPKTDSSV